MSETRKTICDICGMIKPKEYNGTKGWVFVLTYGEEGSKDFCPPCWAPVNRIMLRSFVDGIMMEAQGITEIEDDEALPQG